MVKSYPSYRTWVIVFAAGYLACVFIVLNALVIVWTSTVRPFTVAQTFIGAPYAFCACRAALDLYRRSYKDDFTNASGIAGVMAFVAFLAYLPERSLFLSSWSGISLLLSNIVLGWATGRYSVQRLTKGH